MGVIRRPQQFLAQPQYSPPLSPDYEDAEVLSLFNDGTGKDLAKGNNLTYPADPPAKVLRQQGYALNFDGTNRLITERDLTLPIAFTVFAWVRPDFINFNYARIAETSFSTGFYLGSNNGNSGAAKYAWIVKGASLEGCIGGDQVVGQRDFVVGTYGNLTRKLYVNGVEVASAAASNPASPVSKVYVAHNSGGVNFWRGDIDTFGVYYRTFSADEIWSLYQQPWKLVKAPSRRIFFSAAPSGFTLSADPGSFSIASTDASLKYGRVLPADSGTLAITGTPATLKRGYSLSASSGSASITGASATLKYGRVLSCAGGSIQITAPSAALKYGRRLSAESSAFQIAGTDATLTYATVGSYTLVANPGSFSISGTAASLKYGRRLEADLGAFAFTGSAATLRYARQVIAEAGEFAITGTAATFSRTGGPEPISSTVERTAIFRSLIARQATFQRSKFVSVKFN